MFNRKNLVLLIIVAIVVFNFTLVQSFEMEVPEGHRYDLDGETIRISTQYMFPDIGSSMAIDYFEEPQNRAHLEWVENTFNCNIEIVETPNSIRRGQATDIIPDIMAGDVPAHGHVLSMRVGHAIGRSVSEGIFHGLDKYLDEEYYEGKTLIESLPSTHRFRLQLQGMTPCFYGSIGDLREAESALMIINLDVLNRGGIETEVFLEMVDDREWTWETFREIAHAVTLDTTGDGTIDQGVHVSERLFAEHWLATNDISLVGEVDGRMVSQLSHPRALETYQFLGDLEQELPAVFGRHGPFREGKTLWSIEPWHRREIDEGRIDFNYTWVPLPMGPNISDYITVTPREPVMQYIPITVRNPRAVMEVVFALNRATAPYRDLKDFKEKYITRLSKYAMDRNSVKWREWAVEQEPYLTIWQTVTEGVSIEDALDWGSSMNDAWNAMLHAGESPSIMEMFVRPHQSMLDELFN